MRRHALPLALLAALVLAACPGTTATPPPVNATLAAQRSAELDAAQVDQETIGAEAKAARAADEITAEAFKRVRKAEDNLHAAIVKASAEQKLYLVAGSNRADYDSAFDALAAARRNLSLTWEAARRE